MNDVRLYQYYPSMGLKVLGKVQAKENEATVAAPKARRDVRHNIVSFVAVLCALCFLEGVSVNGLINVGLTSIETRFELSSSQSSLIVSSSDIGATAVVLFVSFYGGRSHRPRVIGGGALVLALGAAFCFLPHFIVGPYSIKDEFSVLPACDDMQDLCLAINTQNVTTSSASRLLPMFMVGQMLQGIGFSPAYSVGCAFIDDNASREDTAFYIGLVYALTGLGVAAGYVLGGQFLTIWTDIGRVDLSKIEITETDKRWVGAWWIGFVISVVLYLIIAPMLCLFPRELAGHHTVDENETRAITAPVISDKSSKTNLQWKNVLLENLIYFATALLDLLRNPVYILLVFVGTADTLLVSGLASFAGKIVEQKFDYSAADAGLLIGGVTIMGGAGGMIMGGIVIRKLRLQLTGMMRLCLIMLFLGALASGGFFIHCEQQPFAGINVGYNLQRQSTFELNDACNSHCSCNTVMFDPVCASDESLTYFSACYAGCPGNTTKQNTKRMYANCTCVQSTVPEKNGVVQSGECASSCNLIWVFIAILFFGMLVTFMNVTPISTAIMRCVTGEERSIGLGLQWVVVRLLGTIPGPILTGYIMDSSCQKWQTTCLGRGKCWVNDRIMMSWRLFTWWIITKLFAFVSLAIAYYLHQSKKTTASKEELQLVYQPPRKSS